MLEVEVHERELTAFNFNVAEGINSFFLTSREDVQAEDAVWVHNCPYNDAFTDHPSFGLGKDFTRTQKRNILEEVRRRNDGQLRDDVTGEPLAQPKQHTRAERSPDNEAHVDHIDPKSGGGSNSCGNANVRSRRNNIENSNK